MDEVKISLKVSNEQKAGFYRKREPMSAIRNFDFPSRMSGIKRERYRFVML
ncbi:MAG: hypothetical protein AAGI92_11930 [Pseudomonadota bacterium]